ncbi:hypothetical protein [Hirschia litorea]|uniref:Uncharacterized protein n=1 Tax=Hirschia litorea TaxID=1199156 RepID=A0ABW2IHI3_9PROT
MKLKHFLSFAVFVSACTTAPIIAEPAAEEVAVAGWLKKDFAEFSGLLEGRWDNERHIFFAEDAGVDLNSLAPRQHIEFQPISAEEDSDSMPSEFQSTELFQDENPISLRHVLSINADKKTIRQTISSVLDGGSSTPAGCVVEWRRQGDQFVGVGSGSTCGEFFRHEGDATSQNVEMTLSDSEFWVTSHGGDVPVESRFRKARPFECWAAVLRGAKHGDSGKGMNDWYFKRGVKIHDQGGEAVLETDETPSHKVRLKLRDVDWTYGTNRPSLTLYVMEGDDDRAVSYTWAEGGADRIGMNLRWIQVSCTHETK